MTRNDVPEPPQVEEARQLLAEARRADPGDRAAWDRARDLVERALLLLRPLLAAHPAVRPVLAQAWWSRGQWHERFAGAGLAEARNSYQEIVTLWRSAPPEERDIREFGVAWMNLGNVLQRFGDVATTEEAVRCYDEAIAVLQETSAPIEEGRRGTLGAAWLNRGSALQRLPEPARQREAVRSFEAAAEELAKLPVETDAQARTLLASAWMNHGIALRQLEPPAPLADVLRSFDEAIAVFGRAAVDESNGKELAVVWLNRAQALRQDPGEEPRAEALRSYDAAIGLLEASARSGDGAAAGILAIAWGGRAQALLPAARREDSLAAADAARQALVWLRERERNDPTAADVAVRARETLCAALSPLLGSEGGQEGAMREMAGELTDAVDDALAVIRLWSTRGVEGWRQPARALFRFGAAVYLQHQPQFFPEFLLDHLDPERGEGVFEDPEFYAAAGELLAQAQTVLRSQLFNQMNGPETETRVERLRELRAVETRLTELRQRSSEKTS